MQHQFLCRQQATIAEWQAARENKKFVSQPTQANRNLFLINGIMSSCNLAGKELKKENKERKQDDAQQESFASKCLDNSSLFLTC
jgi:hypothetical protein